MYEHLTLPEQQRLLETMERRYWDAVDFLGSVAMERATLMNEIQTSWENQNRPALGRFLPAVEASDSVASVQG